MLILSWCIGVMLASALPSLDFPIWWLVVPPIVMVWHRYTRPIAFLILGVGFGVYAGHQLVASQLAEPLEGQEITITGQISDLPEHRERYVRFSFAPHDAAAEDVPSKLLLNWYGAPPIQVGETWQLTVKLRRPRGSVNDGGFDYQRWLMSRGYGATGYVRRNPSNQLIAQRAGVSISGIRASIRGWLSDIPGLNHAALLVALAVGDSSMIEPQTWQVLRQTGTNHLLAISGLHVGLLALFGYGVGRSVRRLGCWAPSRIERWILPLPYVLSMLFALGYALLAGLSLPTQRALAMIIVINASLLLKRKTNVFRPLLLALPIVLVLDPLAAYDLGFWLSFAAVFILLYGFSGRRPIHRLAATTRFDKENSLAVRPRLVQFVARFGGWFLAKSWALGRAQLMLLVGLVLPLTLLNQSVTALAPFANLIAVPLISFLVVVPLLCGVGAYLVLPDSLDWLAQYPIQLADMSLQWGLGWISYVVELAHRLPSIQSIGLAGPSGLAVLCALLGVLWLLSPRGVPNRWLGVLLMLPMLFPRQATQYPLALHVMDVGQGLAIVVQVHERTLVFDTGPKSSERFDAGEAIVLPFLRKRGIHVIDTLVVSHGDNDHAGGAQSLLGLSSVREVILGEAAEFEIPASTSVAQCDSNVQWRWHNVQFDLIEPPPNTVKDNSSNDQSCILVISYLGKTVVIPGDIGRRVERGILGETVLQSPVALLIAAHHGSNTSSGRTFVEQLSPDHVVYSAGFQNSYNHPHPKVVARFESVGSKAWHTGETGQLSYIWDESGELTVEAQREIAKRYWFLP